MADTKLFHGTMNASKSAQLLMQVYNLERQGKTFLIFKPALDTRDRDVVRSRALDEERPATSLSSKDVGVAIMEARLLKPDFIFVDELQFFTEEQVSEFAYIADVLNIPVFAYGLLLSYTGKMFDASKKAIECGFTLHELKMQCDSCKSKSTHHLLYIDGELITNGDKIHVGDQEYKSVCFSCFKKEVNASYVQ